MNIATGKYRFNIQDWDGSTEEKLLIQSRLMECISILHYEEDTDQAIVSMLSVLGKFYGANRAYIFEYDLPKRTMDNTYEWCREGVMPQRESLIGIPLEEIDRWTAYFERGESVVIESLEENVDNDTIEYRQLDRQDITNLIAVPVLLHGIVVGFVGVDDPTAFKENHILLSSVAALVEREIEQKKILEARKQDSIDMLLESNPDIRCACRLDLTENLFLERHGVHGYAKWLVHAETADDLLD